MPPWDSRAPVPCTKGSKIRSEIPRVDASPRVPDEDSQRSPSGKTRTLTRPEGGVNFSALFSRFPTI